MDNRNLAMWAGRSKKHNRAARAFCYGLILFTMVYMILQIGRTWGQREILRQRNQTAEAWKGRTSSEIRGYWWQVKDHVYVTYRGMVMEVKFKDVGR